MIFWEGCMMAESAVTRRESMSDFRVLDYPHSVLTDWVFAKHCLRRPNPQLQLGFDR